MSPIIVASQVTDNKATYFTFNTHASAHGRHSASANEIFNFLISNATEVLYSTNNLQYAT